mgnify:CR=1 FL=1
MGHNDPIPLVPTIGESQGVARTAGASVALSPTDIFRDLVIRSGVAVSVLVFWHSFLYETHVVERGDDWQRQELDTARNPI